MSKPIQIDYNKIYKTNSGKEYKIIEDLGRNNEFNKSHERKVKIKFLETGFEKVTQYSSIKTGKIKDNLAAYLDIMNKTYYSLYYGPLTILSDEGVDNTSFAKPEKLVKVRFHMTGCETITQLRYVLDLSAVDPSVTVFQPTISLIPPDIYDKLINEALIKRWRAMIDRCYSKSNNHYELYGEKGIQVSPIWMTKEGFLSTIRSIDQFDKFYQFPIRYHLDKDYKQFNIPKNMRYYSPETCIFLCMNDNANLAFIERDPESICYASPISYIISRDPFKLFGIEEVKTKNPEIKNYQVKLVIDGKSTYLGTYSDIDAAITVYNHNYFQLMDYELVPLVNYNIFKEMSYEEALTYRTKEIK